MILFMCLAFYSYIRFHKLRYSCVPLFPPPALSRSRRRRRLTRLPRRPQRVHAPVVDLARPHGCLPVAHHLVQDGRPLCVPRRRHRRCRRFVEHPRRPPRPLDGASRPPSLLPPFSLSPGAQLTRYVPPAGLRHSPLLRARRRPHPRPGLRLPLLVLGPLCRPHEVGLGRRLYEPGVPADAPRQPVDGARRRCVRSSHGTESGSSSLQELTLRRSLAVSQRSGTSTRSRSSTAAPRRSCTRTRTGTRSSTTTGASRRRGSR